MQDYLHSVDLNLWLIDLIVRYGLRIKQFDATVEYLNCDVVRITIPKNFQYESLQYCFIMIPELSHLQYHVSEICYLVVEV